MGVSIPCREISGGCDEPIQGESLDELVEVAAAHAVSTHGLAKARSGAKPVRVEIRAAIPKSSRPRAFRGARITFIKT